MATSINFDRAADIYDATRKLPDAASTRITDGLLREIRAAGADRVLEVGIGTGRMARPLMAHGVQIVGVDISQQMMTRLLAQLTPEHTAPGLLLGDATALPLRDGSFRAAIVVHVLHLVASIEEAVLEIRRVLAPGGVLLQQYRVPDEETDRVWRAHDELWDRMLAERGFRRRNRPEPEDIARVLRESGAMLSTAEVGGEVTESTVESELVRLRARFFSWTWEVPVELLDACLPEYEAWLRSISSPDGRFADRVTYVIETARWD